MTEKTLKAWGSGPIRFGDVENEVDVKFVMPI